MLNFLFGSHYNLKRITLNSLLNKFNRESKNFKVPTLTAHENFPNFV